MINNRSVGNGRVIGFSLYLNRIHPHGDRHICSMQKFKKIPMVLAPALSIENQAMSVVLPSAGNCYPSKNNFATIAQALLTPHSNYCKTLLK